jgi:hypothetical protein
VGVSEVNADERGQKHAPTDEKEAKGGIGTANMDEGRQKHTPTRDEETKGGGVSTANADE